MIQFLFRKASRAPTMPTNHPREEKTSKQWTNKLASIADTKSKDVSISEKMDDPEQQPGARVAALANTSLRLEGPYFTPANPAMYETVICLVAGTGVSGAIAIAASFSAQFSSEGCTKFPPAVAPSSERRKNTAEQDKTLQPPNPTQKTWKRCVVIWSIRESDHVRLSFFQESPGLEVRSHLTGKGRTRLDAKKTISEICTNDDAGARTWVYISGPNPFIEAGEKACRDLGVAFFGARWT